MNNQMGGKIETLQGKRNKPIVKPREKRFTGKDIFNILLTTKLTYLALNLIFTPEYQKQTTESVLSCISSGETINYSRENIIPSILYGTSQAVSGRIIKDGESISGEIILKSGERVTFSAEENAIGGISLKIHGLKFEYRNEATQILNETLEQANGEFCDRNLLKRVGHRIGLKLPEILSMNSSKNEN